MSNLFKTEIAQVMRQATSQVEGIIVAATSLSNSTIAANCDPAPGPVAAAKAAPEVARTE